MFPLLVSGTFSGLLGLSLLPLFLRLWPRVLVSARPLFFPPPEANQPRAWCLAPSIASSPDGAPQRQVWGLVSPRAVEMAEVHHQEVHPEYELRLMGETRGKEPTDSIPPV